MNAKRRVVRQMADATTSEKTSLAAFPGDVRIRRDPGCRCAEAYFSRPAYPRLGLGHAGQPGLETGRRQARQKPAWSVSLEELLGSQTRGRYAIEGQSRPIALGARTRRGTQIARPAEHANPTLPQRGVDPLLAPADRRTHVHPGRRIKDRRMLVCRRAAGQTAG